MNLHKRLSDDALKSTWHTFQTTCCQKARERLFRHYYLLCTKTVFLCPRHNHTQDDLLAAAHEGLLCAIDTFDPEKGASFTTYAILKIRVTVMEFLRETCTLTRSQLDRQREIAVAEGVLWRHLGRKPEEEEIAAHLHTTPARLQKCREGLKAGTPTSLESLLQRAESLALSDILPSVDDVECTVFDNAFERAIAEAIARLPERERHVVREYYGQGRTYKDIATDFPVSESRAYQLLQQAIGRLKLRLISWVEEEAV